MTTSGSFQEMFYVPETHGKMFVAATIAAVTARYSHISYAAQGTLLAYLKDVVASKSPSAIIQLCNKEINDIEVYSQFLKNCASTNWHGYDIQKKNTSLPYSPDNLALTQAAAYAFTIIHEMVGKTITGNDHKMLLKKIAGILIKEAGHPVYKNSERVGNLEYPHVLEVFINPIMDEILQKHDIGQALDTKIKDLEDSLKQGQNYIVGEGKSASEQQKIALTIQALRGVSAAFHTMENTIQPHAYER